MIDGALEALGALERAEARLLAWGVVDGAFEEDEILEVFERETGALGIDDDPEDLLDELLRRRLVIPTAEQPQRYRTRMAETVRLAGRLRQLFTKHDGAAWRSAPRLVGDFRFAIGPRRYPTRDLAVDDVLATLGDRLPDLPSATLDAAKAILADRGNDFALSRFQLDAAESILRGIHSDSAGATMVTAGTGSGKTLAFYLPVLAEIASRNAGGPQAIAVYPRRELLKDQFSHTYVEARRLDGVTASGHKIKIGAFFGATPRSARIPADWLRSLGWTPHGEGHACPYLRCPRPVCSGPLVWPDADRAQGIERLACSAARCDVRVEGDEVVLTRERLKRQPPDVVFTTTEMLNQNLSSWEFAGLIGVGSRSLRVALIDEAHTYSGIAGAQAALLLRRWHAAAGQRLHFVGLSATLADAADFFARLTGIPNGSVTLVEPATFDEEGMEYQLVLRGDPASGTQLLSTTIQTAMLVRRALDRRDTPVSQGAAGSKVFVFTDDLDVTNRLYHATRDAEALGPYGQKRRPGATPLAALRATSRDDLEARRLDGQAWDLAEWLGHDLSGETLLGVTRVSSQDAGVNDRSDVIVATASLEVGFNDPEVGAVLQHKAPRDGAAFLQRRGRAGRTRTMRPWTVVSLSDFGRDRLAYDAYDSLFDPTLRPRPLPIMNRAVLRIQATYAWLDWMARRLASSQRESSAWRALAGPGKRTAKQRAAIAALIELTLEDPSVLAEFAAHLRRALALEEEQVDAALWEPPRALVTTVLPTALRRLRSDWYHPARDGGGEGADFRAAYDPLPDFVPPALFSELSLPELQVVTPPQSKNASEETHSVPVLQGMRTFAPGNVSLRFAVERRGARSWLAPPENETLELTAALEHSEPLGTCTYSEDDGSLVDAPWVRPWRIRSEAIPDQVTDSSGGRLHWRSQLHDGPTPHVVTVPKTSAWEAIVQSLEFHTHNRRSAATVRRFAVGGEYSTMTRHGDEVEGRYRFTLGDDPTAVGFELDVDAVVLRPVLPEGVAPEGGDDPASQAFRVALFAERVALDPRLDGVANVFRRRQLEELYISALVDRALGDGTDLPTAWKSLHKGDAGAALQSAVAGIFAAGIPASLSQDDSEERRGTDRLAAVAADPRVIEVLGELGPLLWSGPEDSWETWARKRGLATIAAAVAAACERLAPEFSSDEIIVDVGAGVQTDRSVDTDSVWLSERVVGGGGVIEQVHRRIAADPRRFLRLVDRALAPDDFEVVDVELRRILALAVEQSPVRAALASLRAAASHSERRQRLDEFVAALEGAGVDTRHAVVAAANARILRPATTATTDEALLGLTRDWEEAEQRLGIELETRIFAYACRNRTDLDAAMPEAAGTDAGWRFGQVLGLLWPHGWHARASALGPYNEFAPDVPTDARALRRLVPSPIARVEVGDGWWERMAETLVRDGICELRCRYDERAALGDGLALIGARPIDTGSYLLHPFIERLERSGTTLIATISLEVPSL